VSGNPTLVVTYNGDGSVASTTENGVLTTFTYNTDGTVKTQTRAGVTKTFTYDASGNVTGAA
jgi:YD repeat-containing protein